MGPKERGSPLPRKKDRVVAALLFAATLALTLLSAGCASLSEPFSVREVSPGIFAGPRPRTQADFDALRSYGVRTILSFEQLPWHNSPERRHAREKGFAYVNVPIMASPLQPCEKRVKAALLALSDSSLRPVFIHCFLGEDRSTFIVGLYRIYFQDWTPEAAWKEMLQSGFHVRLTLRGFETYFWSHTWKPDWVVKPRSVKGACMDEGGRPRGDARVGPKRAEPAV
jgi:protein-tyrosine phosphatase